MENDNLNDFNKPYNFDSRGNDQASYDIKSSYRDDYKSTETTGGYEEPKNNNSPKKKKNPLFLLIGLAVIVVAAIAAFLMSGNDEPGATAEDGTTALVYPATAVDTVGNIVSLNAVITPEGTPAVWTSSDENIAVVNNSGEVRLVAEGEADIVCLVNDSVKAVSHITAVAREQQTAPLTPQARESENSDNKDANSNNVKKSGPIEIGWGNYTGPTTDGEADGYGGTVKVTRPYYITLLNGEKLSVSPGDKIENCKFRYGQIVKGTLKRQDGEERSFECGVVI